MTWPRALPALVTAFRTDGSLDVDANRTNIETVGTRGARGVLLAGSTGQGPYLESGERAQLVRAAKDASTDMFVISGVHAETTQAAIAACAESADAGADAVLVVTPTTLVRGRVAAVEQFYLDVADSCSVPVLLYSVPGVTGWALPTDSAVRLAEHPNVVGIKDSGGDPDRVDAMRPAIADGFIVYAGASRALAPSAMHGAWGAITASANYALTEVGLAARGDAAAQSRLTQLTSVVESYGVPGTSFASLVCGLHPGAMRRPLLPVDEEARNAIGHALATAGLGITKEP